NFSGIRAEVTYFKGLMDKLGLEAEIIATGEYKTAGEIVTNEEMSDADREQINDLLDDFYGKITIDLAQDRNVKVSQMVFTIDQGPFMPQEALSKRLIDGLFYRNQLDEELRRLTSNFSGIISSSFYEKTKPEEEIWGPKPAIAVVYATGELKSGKSSSIGIFSSGSCGSETLSNSIISAADNPSVKAIVLRVDSPGGELTASDIILNSIEQAKLRKPVIVSMGDVAASGGYYISCNADKIFAEHSTITGSIGVIAGKLVMKGLYDKIGLKKEIITRGKNATFFSTYKHSTEAQQEKANSQVAEYYENFIEKVSTGRYLSIEMVDSLARGRVWSGLKAVENGLVDQLGGLSDAINEAKMMMNIEGDCDILIYPKYNFFFSPNDLIKSDFTIAVEALGLSSLPEAIPSTGYHYIMPYRIDIK
ncbi:MAG: signal peptide peptidase SppA, partial [candidate division Zixibacteria bacterium]|nr:signal peptide peptidase SppA [candidate division Zixibacteria bacterium]